SDAWRPPGEASSSHEPALDATAGIGMSRGDQAGLDLRPARARAGVGLPDRGERARAAEPLDLRAMLGDRRERRPQRGPRVGRRTERDLPCALSRGLRQALNERLEDPSSLARFEERAARAARDLRRE